MLDSLDIGKFDKRGAFMQNLFHSSPASLKLLLLFCSNNESSKNKQNYVSDFFHEFIF